MRSTPALRLIVSLGAAVALAAPARAQLPERAVTPRAAADSASVLSRAIVLRLEQASLPEAIDAIARAGRFRVSYSAELMAKDARVSLPQRPIRVGEAFARVLAGTGLHVSVLRSGLVVIGPGPAEDAVELRGVVRDAVTGMPVRDAQVVFQNGDNLFSDPFGEFRAGPRAPGDGLTVRRIGYEPSHLVVTAADSQPVIVQLLPAAVAVDRVIVMGSTEGIQERSYAGALTVISGETLERLDLRRLEDIFSGMIPGVVSWDDGPGSTTMALGSIRGSSSFAINYFKTYVDGVEIAAPFIAAGVDPSTVERIEVIRGPQGAALYGSDASSGVVQITTRGARAGAGARPRATLTAERGNMASRFIDGAVPVQAYEAAVDGRFGALAYSAGGTAERSGAFIGGIPANWNTTSRPLAGAEPKTGGASGAHSMFTTSQFVAGPLSGAVSYRASTRAADPAPNPVALAEGFPIRHGATYEQREARRSTSSVSLRLAPVSWWSLRAVGGYDETELASDVNPVPFVSAADSVVAASVGTSGRSSLRVSSEFRTSAAGIVRTTVTLGAERARLSHRSDDEPAGGVSQRDWATGAFAQTSVALANTLVLTAGVRSEANTGFGADHGAVTLPLLGAALARTQGPLTFKLRAAYGKGIRPPAPGAATAGVVHAWQQLPNPDLGPESQRGSEYGVDLHVAAHTRLHLTVFDQIADGLIQLVPINVQARPKTVQQQNIGSIDNKGWEIEGASTLGPLLLSAHYAKTASRVRSVAPRYTGTFRAGDRMLEVPAWTAGVTSALDLGRVQVSATVWRVGDWVNYDWITLYRTVFVERRARGPARNYWITYPGFTRVRVAATARLWSGGELVARGENLNNAQNAGRDNLRVNTGRTIMLGLRLRY